MQDRAPTPGQEGRVLITPESGEPFYAKIEMADNPTQDGTPLNMTTLLKNATAALYDLPETAVPDDVFSAIKTLIDAATNLAASKLMVSTSTYTGTGVGGSSNPTIINVPSWAMFVFIVSEPTTSGSHISTWGNAFFVLPREQTTGGYLGIGGCYNAVIYESKWDGNQLSFSSNSMAKEFDQMNSKNTPYTCYFIGTEE